MRRWWVALALGIGMNTVVLRIATFFAGESEAKIEDRSRISEVQPVV
jgi:hypothetical protein